MKLKTSFLYQIKSLTIGAGILFAMIIIILEVLHLAITFTNPGDIVNLDNINIKWIDLTFVFIVVTAIAASIRSDCKFFIQNGCARLTIFRSSHLSYLFISAVSAGIVVLIHIPKLKVGTEAVFQMLYGNHLLEQFLWTTIISFMVCVIVYLLSTISHLLSRKQNLIVGSGLAVFFIVIIPVLSIFFPALNVIQSLGSGLLQFFGGTISGFSASKAMVNFALVILVVLPANWYLNKKIQIVD